VRRVAVAIITGVALAMPAAAPARTSSDHVAEADSVVSTTSTTYVDLGGPRLTVNITKAGTPVTMWFYAQTMQALPAIVGQTAWFEVVDNGSPIGQSFWDNTNAGWGQGLWAGPNLPSTGAQNITEPLGTFTPSLGKHTYHVLWRAGETGSTVSWRYRTLDVRVGSSTAPPPDLTHPTTP
jgi:hypothetical protein